MSGPLVIPERVGKDLALIAEFFGFELEWNRHLFRHAFQTDMRAGEVFVSALAEAVRQDMRFGTGRRIREKAAQEAKRRGDGRH